MTLTRPSNINDISYYLEYPGKKYLYFSTGIFFNTDVGGKTAKTAAISSIRVQKLTWQVLPR